jgi:hypothetical protein
MAPMTAASQATFVAIQGLWAGPWLRDVAGFDRAATSHQLMLTALAMVAGFLSLGWLAARSRQFGLGPLPVAVAGMIAFLAVQAAIVAGGLGSASLLWIAFGYFGTSGIVAYAALTQRFPPALAGRVNTAINLLAFVAAFLVQWGIGAVIKGFSSTTAEHYPVAGYQAAFGLILALQIAGVAWFFMFRRIRPTAG